MPKKDEKTEEEKEEARKKAAASVEEAIEKLNNAEGAEHEDEVVGENVIQIKEEEKTETVIESTPQTGEKNQDVSGEISSEEEKSSEDQESSSDVGTVFTKSEYQEEKSNSGSKAKIIIVICLIIIFTILGFVGGYFYGKTVASSGSSTPSEESEAIPTFTPTPTEEEVDLSAFSIEILNGSGVSGVAGDEQEALEADGFTVENTGNADNQSYTKTIIAAKTTVSPEFLQKLQDSLSERYVISGDTDELDSDSDYDVVITIGSEIIVDE